MSFSAEEHEEKQRQHLKYFDYAELPVKRWVASYLRQPPELLFDKMTDLQETDGIIFENAGKYWKLYLEPRNLDGPAFDMKPWLNNQKLNNAVKMILDAFQLVYIPVVMTTNYTNNTCETSDDIKLYMDLVAPKFDPKNMCVEFMPVSQEEMKFLGLKNRLLSLDNSLEQIQKIMEKKLDLNNPEILKHYNIMKDEQPKIIAEKAKLEADLSKINHELIRTQKAKLPEISARLENQKKLYIVLEEYQHNINNEFVQKRLPVFGSQYTEPGDESWLKELEEM